MMGAAASVVGVYKGGMSTPRHHATADVIFDSDEAEFLRAIEVYKGATGKKFPTWTDALSVLRNLGWSKQKSWEDETVAVVLAG